jgi:uncharacterized membrane protein
MTFARRNADLQLMLLLPGVFVLSSLIFPDAVPLRAAAGLPFLLFAPGYALVAAFWGTAPLDVAMRVVLAVALSVAACILVALGCQLFDVPVTARTTTLALLVVIVVGGGVALVRRSAADASGPGPAPSLRPVRAWMIAIATCILAFTILLTALRRPLPNPHVAGYSALWALPEGSSRVQLGVRSAEHSATRYRVEIDASTARLRPFTLTLGPGQDWSRVIDMTRLRPQVVTVRLYRLARPKAVYRRVELRM